MLFGELLIIPSLLGYDTRSNEQSPIAVLIGYPNRMIGQARRVGSTTQIPQNPTVDTLQARRPSPFCVLPWISGG
jgi:hypothetical protein